MSIDNLLLALEQAEDGMECFAIITRHLTPQNGFQVYGVPARPGVSHGLFAVDLNAPSLDAIYAHADGYSRIKTVEEMRKFLIELLSKEGFEKALKEVQQ